MYLLRKAYTDSQKDKIAKVMKEFKEGKLRSSSGDVVTDRKQAIAIALSEAGVSLRKSRVKDHTRKTASGKTVMVREHSDSRKKHIETKFYLEKDGKSVIMLRDGEPYENVIGFAGKEDETVWKFRKLKIGSYAHSGARNRAQNGSIKEITKKKVSDLLGGEYKTKVIFPKEKLIKSKIKEHYSQRGGKKFLVREHQDKRTKKEKGPEEGRKREAANIDPETEAATRKFSSLMDHADEHDDPKKFAEGLKPGMGVKSAQEVLAHIEENTDGDHSLSEIKKKVEAAGDHWLRMKVSTETLKGLKVDGDVKNIPPDYSNEEPVVIAGGEVVEGKHRVLAAIRDGRKLSAFMPAGEWHQKVTQATQQAPDETSKVVDGKGRAKSEEAEKGAKKGETETQLLNRGIPAYLVKKCRRAEPGKGGEVELSKAEIDYLLEKGVVGFVSAGKNPKLEKDMKPEDEKTRHEKLKGDLVQAGLKFKQAVGSYDGLEDSFMIMATDANKDEIVKLGKKYNQDSVIFNDAGKNEMIFTTGDNEGKHHPGSGFAYQDEADNYFTKVKTTDGEVKFSLNFEWDKLKKSLIDTVVDFFKKSRISGHYRKAGDNKVFVKEHHRGPTRAIDNVLREREMAAHNGAWNVADNGEAPVKADMYGHLWQMVWQPSTGRYGWNSFHHGLVYPVVDEITGEDFEPHFNDDKSEVVKTSKLKIKAMASGAYLKKK